MFLNIKNPYGNVVLITGATSGIGLSIANLLSNYGFHVYGVSRGVKEFEPMVSGKYGGFIKLLKMDVTNEDSVQSCVDIVLQAEGRIDIVVNAAGMGIAGAVEDTSPQEALSQLDVNFLGTLRVIRAILPIMRAQKCGLIVNISSVAGWVPVPYQSMYSVSKYAIEAMTQSLRMETKKMGIRTVLVEPGDTKTGFTQSRKFTNQTITNTAYRNECERALYSMTVSEMNGDDPQKAAKTVLKMIQKRNPPVRKVVGLQYKLIYGVYRIMPTRWFVNIINLFYTSKKLPDNPVWSFEKNVFN